MPAKTQICPKHRDNPKRAESKKRRGFGRLSIPRKMDEIGMNEIVWCQTHDPLFKVKGIERYRKLKEVR